MLSTRRRVDPGRDNPGSTRDWPVRNPGQSAVDQAHHLRLALAEPCRPAPASRYSMALRDDAAPVQDLFFELETQRDEHRAGLPDWPVFALSWTAVQVGAIIAFQATPMGRSWIGQAYPTRGRTWEDYPTRTRRKNSEGLPANAAQWPNSRGPRKAKPLGTAWRRDGFDSLNSTKSRRRSFAYETGTASVVAP